MVSTQVHWDTYATAVRTATPPPHPFDGLVVILFRVYLHRIGDIININSVLDKIIVSNQVHWDTYATAVRTAAASILRLGGDFIPSLSPHRV